MDLGYKLSIGVNKQKAQWMSVHRRHAPRYAQATFKISRMGTVTSARSLLFKYLSGT